MAAALALAVLALATPAAMAVCGAGFTLPTPGLIAIPGSCSYCTQAAAAVPNFTPSMKITFWALGTGNPAIGSGDDSGMYTVALLNVGASAPALLPYDYSTGTTMVADGDGPFYNYSLTFNTNWGANAAIDGCISLSGPFGSTCTCVLIQDQWKGKGYFAILSDQSDFGGHFSFVNGATMGEIPKAVITSSTRAGLQVNMQLNQANVTAGLNLGSGCACGPVSYKIYQRSVASDMTNSNAPVNRNRTTGGWSLLVASGPIGGANQPASLPCTGDNTDVYLAASLVFPSGFETDIVSANTTKVACDPNLADPVDGNGPSNRPSRPLRPTRGKRTR